MLENFRDKIALSGVAVLGLGIVLLIFTFASAYIFLTQSLSIIASEDLMQTFGEALAPLIATCMRIMYLGVMGWIGSLVTMRGVTIMTHVPETPKTVSQRQAQAGSATEKAERTIKARRKKPKKAVSPPEPEVAVMIPEPVAQQQPSRNRKKKKRPSQSTSGP